MRTGMAIFAALALTLSACTTGSDGRGPDRAGLADRSSTYLVVSSGSGVNIVDAADGSPIAELPQALASPDRATIAAASSVDGSTTISTLDVASGEPIAASMVGGEWELRAVSGFDGSVALTPVRAEVSDPWAPVPRSRTTVVVAKPGDPSKTQRFLLKGNFEPEAFSTDGEFVYMLRYSPALNPDTYRVTRLYLEDGKVWPALGPDKSLVENMTATRLQQALSASGDVLFTLYTNQPPGYLSGDVIEEPDEVAFIHTLDLSSGLAVCIEMPESFGSLEAKDAAIATTPVGRNAFAIDVVSGRILEVNARRAEVTKEATVDLSAIGGGPVTARVSTDGRTLLIAGRLGLVAVDTETLRASSQMPVAQGVTGIAYAEDGASLFVSWPGGIGVLDPITLRTRSVLESPVPGALQFAGSTP